MAERAYQSSALAHIGSPPKIQERGGERGISSFDKSLNHVGGMPGVFGMVGQRKTGSFCQIKYCVHQYSYHRRAGAVATEQRERLKYKGDSSRLHFKTLHGKYHGQQVLASLRW